MTALNVAVSADRIAVVADTLITEAGASPAYTSKCMAFPAQGVAIAAFGHLTMLEASVRLLLNGLPAGATAVDIAETWQVPLQRVWERLGSARGTTLMLAGPEGDGLACFALDAPSFQAQRLERGVYAHPSPYEPTITGAADPGMRAAPRPDEPERLPPMPPEVAAQPWHRLVRAALDVIPAQQRRFPDRIGGWVTMTTLTTEGVHTARMFELPDLRGTP